MPAHETAVAESTVVFNETDWANRIGILQIAEAEGVFGWYSADGQTHYKLNANTDPEEGIGYVDGAGNDAHIRDPEYFSEDERPINPGPWIIGCKSSDLTGAFCINEMRRTIHYLNMSATPKMGADGVVSNNWVPVKADYRQIANLAHALDDLKTFLER